MSDLNPSEPLDWPPHFPPTDEWQQFFIGVRGLGPDLSFFKQLKQQQAGRAESIMTAWGNDPQRIKLTSWFGEVFKKHMGWATPWFIPADRFVVLAHGPRFGWPYFEYEELLELIEEHLKLKLTPDDLHFIASNTLGEVVDYLLVKAPGMNLPGLT